MQKTAGIAIAIGIGITITSNLMLLWAMLVDSLASPWCCSQVPGDWRSRKLLEMGLELQYVLVAKVAPRCQIEIHWCNPVFTNAPHQFSHYEAIQSVDPNFRTPNTLLELSAMRRLDRAQEPDEKSVWSTSDRPAMVVCWWVQVHSGSLNQCFLHRQFVGSFTIKMENFGF